MSALLSLTSFASLQFTKHDLLTFKLSITKSIQRSNRTTNPMFILRISKYYNQPAEAATSVNQSHILSSFIGMSSQYGSLSNGDKMIFLEPF